MRRFFCIMSFLSIFHTSSGQLNNFEPPFENSSKIEPNRSEFISYRRSSGTKGSPIDTALSYKLVTDWMVNSSKNQITATADLVIPFDYMDKALYLNVGATNGAVSVFVNDKEVGHRTDSKLSAEFNITSFVERGLNKIKLVVSSEKIIQQIEQNENLDIDFSEIHLFAQPKIRIFDITTRTSLDPTYKNGLLEIALLLKTELLNPHTVTVFYDLYDQSGKLVNQESKEVLIDMRVQDTVRFTATIFNVKKWNHEDPYLYTVEFRIKREGRFTEYMWNNIGFRTIETLNKELVINGVSTKLYGINADIFPALTNSTTPSAALLKTIETLKFAGINAIQTPYPLKRSIYDICDSLGMYVFETTNINSANNPKSIFKDGTLANDPAWASIFVDRAVGTYERSKVHPSVIALGLGLDAGNGYNMYQAYLEIKKRDPKRLVIYNDADKEWNTDISMLKYDPIAVQPTIIGKAEDFKILDIASGAFLNKPVTNDELANLITVKSIEIEAINPQKGIFNIKNNLQSTNLKDIPCSYRVFNKNGNVTKTGSFTIELAPSKSIDIEITSAGGKNIEIIIGKITKYRN